MKNKRKLGRSLYTGSGQLRACLQAVAPMVKSYVCNEQLYIPVRMSLSKRQYNNKLDRTRVWAIRKTRLTDPWA